MSLAMVSWGIAWTNAKILNEFLGFNINIVRKNANKNYSRYLNKKSILLINEFYKKDFELFNYDFEYKPKSQPINYRTMYIYNTQKYRFYK